MQEKNLKRHYEFETYLKLSIMVLRSKAVSYLSQITFYGTWMQGQIPTQARRGARAFQTFLKCYLTFSLRLQQFHAKNRNLYLVSIKSLKFIFKSKFYNIKNLLIY